MPGPRGAAERGKKARAVLLSSLVGLALAFPASAQELSPGTRLRSIETQSFSFYFPPELEAEARRLASEAEDIRETLLSRFMQAGAREKAPKRGKLPVLLAGEEEEANGYYSSYPSDRIVLYAAAPEGDGSLGLFDDELLSLFTHELTHALSMGQRSPFFRRVQWLFGDALAPADYTAPLVFVEGVTVASESEGGYGRVHDPLAAGLARQALIEDKAPDFWQASGAYDLYPFGQSYYIYGGLFSAWLRDRYGPEAYAALWRDFGAGRFPEDGLFSKGAFSRAYGMDLDKAWKDFLADSQLERSVLTSLRPLDLPRGYLSAMTAGGGNASILLVWADPTRGAVFSLKIEDGKAGRPERLFAADGHVNRLALSLDRKRLLVSSARLEGPWSRLVLREWDLAEGRWLPGERRGLREASYAGQPASDGSYPIVALKMDNFLLSVVEIEGGLARGTENILLAGSEERQPSAPSARDGAVYSIVKDRGRRVLIKLEGGGAWVLAPTRPLERLRFLSSSPEGLALATASRDGLYRLVLLKEGSEGPRLRVQSRELSGGVQSPALVGGGAGREELFYSARLAEGQVIARYPFELASLSIEEVDASWIKLDGSYLRALPPPNGASLVLESRPAPPLPLIGRTYRLPSISPDWDAAGLVLMGSDIGERIEWNAEVLYGWDIQAVSASAEVLARLGAWSLEAALSDRFSARGSGDYLRESSVGLDIARGFSFFPARRRLDVGLALEGGILGEAKPGQAYAGDSVYTSLAARARIGYSDLRSTYFPPLHPAGFSARLYADTEAALELSGLPRSSLGLSLYAALPRARLQLSAEAAYSPGAEVLFGTGGRELRFGAEGTSLGAAPLLGPSSLSAGYPAYREYEDEELMGSLYAFAEAKALLISAEIQERLWKSALYLRRLNISGGYRSACIGGLTADGAEARILSSAFGLLELEACPLLGQFAAIGYILGIECAYAFDEAYADRPWSLGFNLSLRF